MLSDDILEFKDIVQLKRTQVMYKNDPKLQASLTELDKLLKEIADYLDTPPKKHT